MFKSMNITTLTVLLCLTSAAFPVESLSRWFSASYADLQITMRRYGHCVTGLSPKRDNSGNETDYLIAKMKIFLDQANFGNDHLSNVTALMDNLCRPEPNADYPISIHIDVNHFNGTNGKRNRCKAIDQAMDAMYYVFKRAAMNSSEPLDFSVIQYYPNGTNNEASYNLTDLINTSWIKSETQVEHICKITDAIKEYVEAKSKLNADRRSNILKTTGGYYEAYWNIVDYLLEPLLGFERRFYLETNNRVEMIYNLVANQLAYVRDGVGRGVSATSRYFGSRNKTLVVANSTQLNSTKFPTTLGPLVPELPVTSAPTPLNASNSSTNAI